MKVLRVKDVCEIIEMNSEKVIVSDTCQILNDN